MSDNKIEIGGYFEFDLPNLGQFPYPQALKYNSARSAFFDLLDQNKIKSVWMPKLICDSMIKPLLILGIKIQYYNMDDSFYPNIPIQLHDNEYLFYINYFGLFTDVQEQLLDRYPRSKIIFDHSQAFFVKPFDCFATIYSPRKFLPVAEGGLLVSRSITIPNYSDRDVLEMIQQYKHCLIRLSSTAKEGYETFRYNEDLLNDCVPKVMSKITEEILLSLDYLSLKEARIVNFNFLHSILGDMNQLKINMNNVESPLTYPLLLDKKYSDELLEENIFTPTYWLDCLERVSIDSIEYRFVVDTTHLVCDHRYACKEMQIQINKIKDILL